MKKNKVDWTDPRLAKLLERSAEWQLDHRGIHTPTRVKVHLGMGASGYREADLIYKRDNVAILMANFPIATGERVQFDETSIGKVRSYFGTVSDFRPGQRAEDNGEFIHWIHLN